MSCALATGVGLVALFKKINLTRRSIARLWVAEVVCRSSLSDGGVPSQSYSGGRRCSLSFEFKSVKPATATQAGPDDAVIVEKDMV